MTFPNPNPKPPMRVLAFGTFDLFHEGHRYYLSEAAKRGELTVVVARDATVKRIKGHLPEHTEKQRRARVAAEFPNAVVVLGDEEDFRKPLALLRPELLCLGYDQSLPPGLTEGDLPCPVQRIGAWKPEEFKTSLKRKRTKGM